MSAEITRCPNCGRRNRVPAAAAGTPQCGNCHQPLPWITDAGDDSFGEVVEAAKVPVLVDLWAPWCGPCRVVSPILEEINADREDVVVKKVNIDDNMQIAATYGILAIPTMILFRNGSEAARIQGAMPKKRIEAQLEPALAA